MSGPKKADVQAQLNIARSSQRRCETLIADTENAAISRILKETESVLAAVDRDAKKAHTEIGKLSDEALRLAPDSVSGANAAIRDAQRLVDEARQGVKAARDVVSKALRAEADARDIFESAEREYKRAATALRSSGSHYLQNEMSWAQAATNLYDQAAARLKAAAQVRKKAEQAAAAAMQGGGSARDAMRNALRQLHSTGIEVEARRKAEEEARKIKEQKRREAVVALERSRAGISRLDELPHRKFQPGAADKLQRELDAASGMMQGGHFDEARSAAERLQKAASALELKVVEALRAFECRKAEVETQAALLEAALRETDQGLIKEWSDVPDAVVKATSSVEAIKKAIADENFDAAEKQAIDERQALSDALRSAAENKRLHENREKTGQSVMEALHELGFQVTFEPGTKTEPLRIVGQTPEVSGKGDFDIEIPLDGDVDFEVNTPQGDTTCVSAVHELQKRLAERGIKWNTTDWGHAEGAKLNDGVKIGQTIKEQVHIKAKH